MTRVPDIKTSGASGKMQVRDDAPPGLEQDGHGNPIPVEQRTQEHKQAAKANRKHAAKRPRP